MSRTTQLFKDTLSKLNISLSFRERAGERGFAQIACNKWQKFCALPREEKKLFLLAAAYLPLIHLRLKCCGLKSCMVWIGVENIGPSQRKVSDPAQYEQACSIERSVVRAAYHGPIFGTCLSRSLTVLLLMQSRKIPGDLCIGVNPGNGSLDAHAWVEIAGMPLGQADITHTRFACGQGW